MRPPGVRRGDHPKEGHGRVHPVEPPPSPPPAFQGLGFGVWGLGLRLMDFLIFGGLLHAEVSG